MHSNQNLLLLAKSVYTNLYYIEIDTQLDKTVTWITRYHISLYTETQSWHTSYLMNTCQENVKDLNYEPCS